MSRPSTTLSPGGRPSQTPRRTGTKTARRSLKTLAFTATGLILLSGCSTQWASMSPSITTKKADVQTVSATEVTPTATPSTTTTATATSGGELADGSAKHTQAVGDAQLVISYWTDGTSDDDVHLSATLKKADTEHTVKVTRFTATLNNGDTSTQLADDQGEFVLTPPYSYTSALALPATPSAGSTIEVRFDLLLETAPGSGAFYRQTVLDTVELTGATK